MARRAELAGFLKPGIGVLSRSDIVQGSGEELMSVKRSPEFKGENPGFSGYGSPVAGLNWTFQTLWQKSQVTPSASTP
jgi:hypothetical protein